MISDVFCRGRHLQFPKDAVSTVQIVGCSATWTERVSIRKEMLPA
ncbi:hypothetical protein [Rubritalea tangerina]